MLRTRASDAPDAVQFFHEIHSISSESKALGLRFGVRSSKDVSELSHGNHGSNLTPNRGIGRNRGNGAKTDPTRKSFDLLDREVRGEFLRWKEVPHDLEQLCSNGFAKDAPSKEIY